MQPGTINKTPRQRAAAAAAAAAAQPQQPTLDISVLDPGNLLTKQELADVLRTNTRAIDKAIAEGRDWVPKVYRLGNRRIDYFLKADVLAMLQPAREAA